ncbi:MAG TPA: filamentous hemagglutinin N-terminal domain-containing protein [Burkholderiales bacterium]|jgi:filamentous hemagglutinin family protein|nr:filamentous hemagglutinin N-terminal domain-containing protein [Burkholderiales bacterium]
MDGRLGAAGPLAGPNFAIPDTLGQQVGSNLFHSFSQFSLTSGQSATFSGPAGITHVIGRVTGGAPSSIDGTIRSTISGAALWLINPSGMAFGPNARLDLQGSFHASTASYLKLGSSGRFDAANPGASVLTVDAPVAFGFLGAPAPLTVDRSQLITPVGATLSLVGGNVSIAGTTAARPLVIAPGGHVNLASLAAPGEATLAGGAIDTSGAPVLGTISLVNANLTTENPSSPALPGPITIRGGRLALENSLVSTAHARPGTGSDIDIALTGDLQVSGGQIRTTANGGGNPGDISLRAANVSLAGGAIVDTSAFILLGGTVLGGGHAGNITIEASGDVALLGASRLGNLSFSGGTPSETRITARDVTISERAGIDVSTFGAGAAGNVSISARNLTVSGGGRIAATPQFDIASTPGTGPGGRIDVVASGTVAVTGADSSISTSTASAGAGGSINMAAQDIVVSDGGRISASSQNPFGIAAGDAGAINLSAGGSVRLSGGGAITTQAATAGGGQVTIRAGESLVLTDSRITTSVGNGAGNGGNILVDPVFVVLANSQILARAVGGNGGDITIVTQYLMVSPAESINQSINASSEKGISGTILITSPVSDIGTRLATLPSGYVDPSQLLRAACGARAVGNSFAGVGRGGLPASPSGAGFAGYRLGAVSAVQKTGSLLFARRPEQSPSVLTPCPG